VDWVALLLYIHVVPASIIVPNTDYFDILRVSPVSAVKFRNKVMKIKISLSSVSIIISAFKLTLPFTGT
jgi:fatty acid-binding protein DegV